MSSNMFGANAPTTKMLEMAQLARAAYDGEDIPAGWDYVPMSQLSTPFNMLNGTKYYEGPQDTQAIVLTKGNEVVISVRGSEINFPDWYYNIGHAQNNPTSDAHENLENLILAVKYQYPNAEISFTGHSLGGALVNQIALHSSDYNLSGQTQYYAFNSPFNAPDSYVVHNWINSTDPVSNFYQNNMFPDPDGITFLQNATKLIGENVEILQPHLAQDYPYWDKYEDHIIKTQIDAIEQMQSSAFADELKIDSQIKVVSETAWSPIDLNGIVLNNDTFIFGSKNNDFIMMSRDHSEKIDTGAGDDYIVVTGGNDTVYGGAGSDTFKIADDFNGGDLHTIKDFNTTEYDWVDMYGIAGLNHRNLEDRLTDTADGLFIRGDYTAVVVEGMTKQQLIDAPHMVRVNFNPWAGSSGGNADHTQTLSGKLQGTDVETPDTLYFMITSAPAGFSADTEGNYTWNYTSSGAGPVPGIDQQIVEYLVIDEMGAYDQGGFYINWSVPVDNGFVV